MNDDRDEDLLALFEIAGAEQWSDSFSDDVLSKVDRQRRGTLVAWLLAGIAVVGALWLASGPVMQVVDLAAQTLPRSIIDVQFDNSFVRELLAPINSISAAVGFGFLILWGFFRKIFG